MIQEAVGPLEFMLFFQFDRGAVVNKGVQNAPRIIRLLIGNPLIMASMAQHIPDAGSYAPVTVLIDERKDGVYLSYDRMASVLAPYGNSEVLTIAHDLDSNCYSKPQSGR